MGILKLIGILLLALLGILLIAVLLVLFVPVRYRVKGTFSGSFRGMGEISWLFHLIFCRITYEGEPETEIRILGIPIGGTGAGTEENDGECPMPEMGRASGIPEEKKDAQSQEPEQEKRVTQTGEAMEVCRQQGPEKKGRKPKTEGKSRPSASRRVSLVWVRLRRKADAVWEKIRVTFQRICGKLKRMTSRWQQLTEFLQKEENRETFQNIKGQLAALFRHIRPRYLKGRIRFGFDDPFTTGQVLTWISPFYPLYARNLTVIPVFEEPVMEGEVDLKGRIRLSALLWIGVKVMRDKNFRTLLAKWRAA